MTRTVSASHQTALDGPTTSETTLWTVMPITLPNLLLTAHDQDIVFGGNTYVAAVGYQTSDLAANATLAVDSADIQGILNTAAIKESDLRGGRYDYAEVRISKINWKDPDGDGEISLARGWFGEVVFDEVSGQFSTELRGLSQVFSQTIVEHYGRTCRYSVGDSRCNRDNLVPIFPDLIQASTAYAVGDVVRVPAIGASNPPITEDFGDTHYRVTVAGTTGTGVNNFPTQLSSASTSATTLDVDDTNTISRATGSFIDDGWEVDMVYRSTGFTDAANNGDFRISAVTALTMDVTASTLVAESGTGDEVLTHIAKNNGVEFTAENALRVAGEIIEVINQYQFVVGPPSGGGLLTEPLFIENPGFETGDFTGWTTITAGSGNFIVTSPVHSGTYAMEPVRAWSGPASDTEIGQTRDVTEYAALIDAGGETITVQWWYHGTGGAAARTRISFEFLDAADAPISTHVGTKMWNGTGVYVQQTETGTIPVNTRKVVIVFWAGDFVGDIWIDDFTVSTSLVDANFPDDEFNYGVMTWDSGNNVGLSMDVKDYNGTTKIFTLYQSMPFPISVGDKIGVHIGCNREPSRCLALGNKINFGGFEFIPGDDEFLRYPDSPY